MIQFQIPYKENYFNAYGINQDLNTTPIYFSHANGFNGFMYKTLLNKISNNQKIISYDLRGHGKSTIPAEPDKLKSWHRYSDDLINILNKNQKPSILICHSLGGTTSLLVALKRPELVSKIILIDPVLLPLTYWLGTKAMQSIGLIEKIHPMVRGALIRKNSWTSKEEAFEYGGFAFAKEALNLIDNLERSKKILENDEFLKNSEALKKTLEHFDIITKDLIFIFSKNNIKPIESLNKKLDPNLHQAMMEIEDDQKEPGTIIQEIQKGFTIKDRLLRPSLVGVSKKSENKNIKNEELRFEQLNCRK